MDMSFAQSSIRDESREKASNKLGNDPSLDRFSATGTQELNQMVNSMSVIVVDDKVDENKGFQTERIAYHKAATSNELTKNLVEPEKATFVPMKTQSEKKVH